MELVTQRCGITGVILFALTTNRIGRRPWFVGAFIGGAVTLLIKKSQQCFRLSR